MHRRDKSGEDDGNEREGIGNDRLGGGGEDGGDDDLMSRETRSMKPPIETIVMMLLMWPSGVLRRCSVIPYKTE